MKSLCRPIRLSGRSTTLLITPHTAAVTERLWERHYRLIVDNMKRFLAGEPLAESKWIRSEDIEEAIGNWFSKVSSVARDPYSSDDFRAKKHLDGLGSRTMKS